MIREHLGEYLTPDQIQNVFMPAISLRGLAATLYKRRRDHMDALAEQMNSGLWRSEEVRGAMAGARRDHALLWYQQQEFIRASGDQQDLDITYHPLANAIADQLQEDDFRCLDAFLQRSTPGLPEAIWLSALRLEASAYLAQLWGDWYLERALAELDAVVELVLSATSGRDLFEPRVILAHILAITLDRYYGLPKRVETAYERLRAIYAHGDNALFPWQERLDADPKFRRDTGQFFATLLKVISDVKAMRNPSDRSEIDYLTSQRRIPKAPLVLLPDSRIDPMPPLSEAERQRTDRAFGRVLEVLPADAGRPTQVLRLWRAKLHLAHNDMRRALDELAGVDPDAEALGILVHATRGEAQYHLADYEDGYRGLREASALGETILARGNAQVGDLASSRHFLARLAQKEGNALFYMGDEAQAGSTYERARHFAEGDPLAEATYLVDLGNLAYLRNNLVDQRGYVTLDGVEMWKLAKEQPAAIQALRLARHATDLVKAEDHYREALQRLGSSGQNDGRVTDLQGTIHVNLGNLAWAWARAMEMEDVDVLSSLPMDQEWHSQLVERTSTRAACYQVAIGQQEQAMAVAGDNRAIEATCHCNLSELYLLLARATGDRQYLDRGLEAAHRALALLGDHLVGGNAEVLAAQGTYMPEGVWRTTYNLARLYEECEDQEAAATYYAHALRVVEAMRAMIRLDAWQATFLQDKLEVYEDYVRFLYRRDSQGNKGRIFDLMEMTKARSFLDLLAGARLNVEVGADLAARRDGLLGRIAACNEEIRRAIVANDAERVNALQKEQQEYVLHWQDVQSEILAEQQANGDLNPPLVTLDDLNAWLRDQGAVVLSYLLGVRNSYLLLSDGQEVHLFELEARRTIEYQVMRLVWYCQQSGTQSFDQFHEANQQVTRLLLGPALAQLNLADYVGDRKLVVIPDGGLFYLPFEVLLAGQGTTEEPLGYESLRPRYLMAHSDINYVPSASAWLYLAMRQPRRAATSVLGVYDINYDLGEPPRERWALPILAQLRNLPGTHRVARILAQFEARYPDQPTVHARAWREDRTPEIPEFQSTEGNLVRLIEAHRPRYVLFSGHAVCNDKYPNLSGLILNLPPVATADGGDVPPSGPGDGFLRLEELFSLAMDHAELTFLAACQTGLGSVHRGEGINALTRAFMYRGSPSVIASLWAVSDNSTQLLTRAFFDLLVEQPDADRAHLLAEAKRAVMNQDRYCLPWYWAPFTLTGARAVAKKGA